jgi:hypothetical protein
VGRAVDVWQRLSEALTSGDVTDVVELYGPDAIYLEPYNPPHRGNLLIQAYLKDWLGGKADVAIDVKRLLESPAGDAAGIEWTISYDAAGRRWSDLPRATFIALDADGQVTYHRDYT